MQLQDIQIVPVVGVEGVIPCSDDALYHDPVLRTAYYNHYYSYGRHFRPRSVFEVGVRAGYTGYFILKGAAGSVARYRGIDLEVYVGGSNARAHRLLGMVCSDVDIAHGDSHALESLDAEYDLIHVDGDHSYAGKVMDLELAYEALAPGGVIVVDDCWNDGGPKAEVLRATEAFVASRGARSRWIRPLCGSPLNPTNGHILIMRP